MVDVGRRRRGPTRTTTNTAATPAWRRPPVDPAVATQTLILRALKRRVELGRFGPEDAVDEALLQLSRAGGPRLADEDRARLRATLTTLARTLTPPSAKALYVFAKDAAKLGWQLHRAGRSPGAVIRERADVERGGDLRALAEAAVYRELLHAKDDEDLIRRAVTRALGERRRGAPGRVVPLENGDPVRDLLDLPSSGRVRLPRGDVRGAIAHAAKNDAGLGGLLRQVAVFSKPVMEEALGDELSVLCRPVGFTDPRRSKVLVVTASSVAAQETQLRSRELLYRLQQLPALAHITGVRVVVDRRAFLGS
jgi:hypothetical protein